MFSLPTIEISIRILCSWINISYNMTNNEKANHIKPNGIEASVQLGVWIGFWALSSGQSGALIRFLSCIWFQFFRTDPNINTQSHRAWSWSSKLLVISVVGLLLFYFSCLIAYVWWQWVRWALVSYDHCILVSLYYTWWNPKLLCAKLYSKWNCIFCCFYSKVVVMKTL